MFVERLLSEVRTPVKSAIPEQCFRKLREYGRFAIWGTGRAAKYGVEQCKELDLVPACVCDSFPHESGEKFEGLPLLSAETFFQLYPSCPVLICCSVFYGITEQLKEKKHPIITWDTYLLDNFIDGQPLETELQCNQGVVNRLYDMLADERSRQTYENVLKYRLTLERKYLERVYEPNIYFNNDVIPQINGKSFIDCGAYVGDTLAQFNMSSCCKCTDYYALEPDEAHCERIRSYISEKQITGVHIIPVAAWGKKTRLKFNSAGVGSGCVSELLEEDSVSTKRIEIQADKLDNVIPIGGSVDFIKMDIEGSEIPAIYGAAKIIQRDTPTLAISVYHKKTDLWEIPLLLHKLNPMYRLYVRHHTMQVDDTVCYAVDSRII